MTANSDTTPGGNLHSSDFRDLCAESWRHRPSDKPPYTIIDTKGI